MLFTQHNVRHMNSKISLTILGMILGIAATGLVTALSMTETALAVVTPGGGGGCGVGDCGGTATAFRKRCL